MNAPVRRLSIVVAILFASLLVSTTLIQYVFAADLNARPRDKHVVITGRNAKPELLAIADLVTEMTLVKHPFEQGIKAQRGIDF